MIWRRLRRGRKSDSLRNGWKSPTGRRKRMPHMEHWAKFKPDERLVADFDHWLIVIRPKQVTLGSCVFLLKRPATGLGDLSPSEASELPSVAAWFEERLKRVFEAEKFNYVAAMMKDPYVHFHAFPRYSAAREFAGRKWEDHAWPAVVRFEDVDS